MKRRISLPLSVSIHAGATDRQVTIKNWRDAEVLYALVKAEGGWIEPQDLGIGASTLSRRAAGLRRHYGLPVESDAVQQNGAFHNRHRLITSVAIKIRTAGKEV